MAATSIDMSTTATGELLTADGRPLKESLQRSLRRRKLTALALVAPAVVFLFVLFGMPVIYLMTWSVDDTQVNNALPRTFAAYQQWDGEELPSEPLYEAMFKDVAEASGIQIGRASTRMNYAKSKWKSLMKKTKRQVKALLGTDPDFAGPYKEALIGIDKRWEDISFWHSLGIMKDPYTLGYYLNSFDLQYGFGKEVVQQPENRRIYKTLWMRTLMISVIVTLACLALGYPVAHLLATLPLRYSNLLMICVLMPFWTSLLVRIVAWMIMLQQEGVINDTLVWLRLVGDESRWQMMYNFTGTIIVMTQILLPFMILPVYSVMKGISPAYMKAAQNLGAPPAIAFLRVYVPQSLPGVGAGVILVFIVAIGYFITPELVGGKDGQMIGNYIAYHLKSSLNWGLASAMGVILLTAILILYWVYDRVVGIDNMKMG